MLIQIYKKFELSDFHKYWIKVVYVWHLYDLWLLSLITMFLLIQNVFGISFRKQQIRPWKLSFFRKKNYPKIIQLSIIHDSIDWCCSMIWSTQLLGNLPKCQFQSEFHLRNLKIPSCWKLRISWESCLVYILKRFFTF